MKPKKTSLWKALGISALAALKLASASPAQESKPIEPVKQDSTLEITGRTDVLNKYIYRGMNFGDNLVTQQYVTLTNGNLTFIGFANLDHRSGQINEVDGIIDYTFLLKDNVKLSAGYAYFALPNTDSRDTQEVYVGTSLDTFLNPGLTFVHDFKDGDGNYVEASVSNTFDLGIPVNACAKLGYNDHYYRQRSGLSHLELSVSTPIELGPLIATPCFSYSAALDNDFEDEAFAGVSFEYKIK